MDINDFVLINNEKDWINVLVSLGTLFIGVLTFRVTRKQKNLDEQQHNSMLFEKRWAFWKETQELGYKCLSFKHVYYEEIKGDITKNYSAMGNEIKMLGRKAVVLFDEKLEQQFNKIADIFLEMNKLEDELERQKRNFEKDTNNLFFKIQALRGELLGEWDRAKDQIFGKIKKLKISNE